MATSRYNYKFLEDLKDSLKCVVCLEVVKEARQHETCGKLMCRKCVEKNAHNPCPNCRAPNPKFFIDKRGEMEIANLGVRCDNLDRGCLWEGTVSTLEDHIQMCPFTPVVCPNNCNLVEAKKSSSDDATSPTTTEIHAFCLIRKDLDTHLNSQCPKRLHSCEHCNAKGIYMDMTTSHLETCPKLEIQCTNHQCDLKMTREGLAAHLKSCPYTRVDCKYKEIGCCRQKMRKDIQEHEDDLKSHLKLACSHVEDQMAAIENLKGMKAKIEEFNTRVLTNGEEATFKLENYLLMKENDGVFTSEPFYVTHGGYKMCIKIYPNGTDKGKETNISAFVEILKGNFDEDLSWPFQGSLSLKILNQNSDKEHYGMTKTSNHSSNLIVGSSFGFSQFIQHTALSPEDTAAGNNSHNFLANDQLYFRVKVNVQNHKQWLNCNLVPRGDRDRNGILLILST